MYTNWTTTGGMIQGDVAITLERSRVYPDTIDFIITGYSEKWSKYDISFEYRKDPRDEWKSDSSIVFAQSDYINDNRIYGLDASKDGEIRSFKWKYIDNAIFYGELPEVRVNIIPRVRSFSTSNEAHIISEAFADGKVDIKAYSTSHRVIGLNNQGDYICTTLPNQESIEIRRPSDFSFVSSFVGVLRPSYVTQILSGRYIVADTDNNRVLELDEDLTTILKSFPIIGPSFVDYSEEDEAALIVSSPFGRVYELTWSDISYGGYVWQSPIQLNEPTCATYAEDDAMIIVATSMGDNKIAIFDKTQGTTQLINGADLGQDKSLDFYKPFRVYRLNDKSICVIEKEGRRIDFASAESSSSSSIDSSSSSSSTPEITLNPGDTYSLPSSELRTVYFRFTGGPATTATVILNTSYSYTVGDVGGSFVWDIGGMSQHTFTSVGESIIQIAGSNSYTIVWNGFGSQLFAARFEDHMSSSSESSSSISSSSSSSSSVSSSSSSSSSVDFSSSSSSSYDDYTFFVYGTGSPNAVGTYVRAGQSIADPNYPLYKHTTQNWWIEWIGGSWVLSDVNGFPANFYYGPNIPPYTYPRVGTYTGYGSYAGKSMIVSDNPMSSSSSSSNSSSSSSSKSSASSESSQGLGETYCMSGSWPSMDGTYTWNGTYFNGQRVFTNGTYYLYFSTMFWSQPWEHTWLFSEVFATDNFYDIDALKSLDSMVITGGYTDRNFMVYSGTVVSC